VILVVWWVHATQTILVRTSHITNKVKLFIRPCNWYANLLMLVGHLSFLKFDVVLDYITIEKTIRHNAKPYYWISNMQICTYWVWGLFYSPFYKPTKNCLQTQTWHYGVQKISSFQATLHENFAWPLRCFLNTPLSMLDYENMLDLDWTPPLFTIQFTTLNHIFSLSFIPTRFKRSEANKHKHIRVAAAKLEKKKWVAFTGENIRISLKPREQ